MHSFQFFYFNVKIARGIETKATFLVLYYYSYTNYKYILTYIVLLLRYISKVNENNAKQN